LESRSKAARVWGSRRRTWASRHSYRAIRAAVSSSGSHHCEEIYFILEGEGTLELEEESFPLRPGTLIYIPRGVRHRGYGDFRTAIVGIPPLQEGDEYFA